MIPPFRADHIGSLLRPKKLREAFRAHSMGQISTDALRAAQDEAILRGAWFERMPLTLRWNHGKRED